MLNLKYHHSCIFLILFTSFLDIFIITFKPLSLFWQFLKVSLVSPKRLQLAVE